jgi:hypothetical protein
MLSSDRKFMPHCTLQAHAFHESRDAAADLPTGASVIRRNYIAVEQRTRLIGKQYGKFGEDLLLVLHYGQVAPAGRMAGAISARWSEDSMSYPLRRAFSKQS